MFDFKNITLLMFIILLCSLAIQPSNFIFETIEVDQPSEKDIFAPKSLSFVDEKATEQLKQEALSQVQDVYDHDKNIYTKIEEDMNTFLSSLSEKKNVINKTITAENQKEIQDRTIDINEFAQKEISSVLNPFGFTTNELLTLMKIESTSLKKYTDQLLREMKPVLYDKGVTQELLETTKLSFKSEAEKLVFYTSGSVDEVSTFLISKLAERITVNFSLNIEETKLREEEALLSIEPVYKQVAKGELIVAKGVKVTEDTYEKLKKLGMIETDFKYKEFFFQIPYVALMLLILHFYCFRFFSVIFDQFKQYLFLLLSIFSLMLSSNFIDELRFFLIPLVLFLFIATIIWGRNFVLALSVITALLLYSGEFIYCAMVIVIGFIIAIKYKPGGDRLGLIKTGVLVGFIFVVAQFIFRFSINKDVSTLSFNFYDNAMFLFSTSFAAILTIGFIPVVEKFLSIATYFRLHEYNDPSHPLIKRLIMEAPGTYDHSVKVGNLAELAADKIGANGLLVRVAAYYHDVGKMTSPEHFIENTTPGTNPHNRLEPYESAKLILSHPMNGVKLCKEYDLPQLIINFVASHHSDSLLKQFYLKAKELDPTVNEADFRYNCPTPKTKEEGILMLADSTEAYSRVLLEKQLSKEELDQAIRKSIYSKVSQGDLRDCTLTFEELEVIIETFVYYLSKSNHKRISYNNDNSKEI